MTGGPLPAGDDYLDGGDGQDLLDGGYDFDTCTRSEIYRKTLRSHPVAAGLPSPSEKLNPPTHSLVVSPGGSSRPNKLRQFLTPKT